MEQMMTKPVEIPVDRKFISPVDSLVTYSCEQLINAIYVRVTFLFHLNHNFTVKSICWIITINAGGINEEYVFEGTELNVHKSSVLKDGDLQIRVKEMYYAIEKALKRELYELSIVSYDMQKISNW
jgi:hypothetical protein